MTDASLESDGRKGGSFDLVVLGSGVIAAAVARDAAGRGLKVALVADDDVVGAPASPLDGLLVASLRERPSPDGLALRGAVAEAERLWRLAPHLVRPLEIVVPRLPSLTERVRLRWRARLPGRRLLPAARMLDLRLDPASAPLAVGFTRALAATEVLPNPDRLVIAMVRDAVRGGADLRLRRRVEAVTGEAGAWQLALGGSVEGERLSAAMIVVTPRMAAGLPASVGLSHQPVLVRRTIHAVLPRLYRHERGYLFSTARGRRLLVVPYERTHMLMAMSGAVAGPASRESTVSAEELQEICRLASAFFRVPVGVDEIAWSFATTEHDLAAPSPARRQHRPGAAQANRPPLFLLPDVPVIDARRRATEIVSAIAPGSVRRDDWTATAALPGGGMAPDGVAAAVHALLTSYPFLEAGEAMRLIETYGTEAAVVLGDARTAADLGPRQTGLPTRELAHLLAEEWATTADEVLWRRTKLGLAVTPGERTALGELLGRRAQP